MNPSMEKKERENKETEQRPRRRLRLSTVFSVLIFLLGLAIFLYPVISRFYYRIETTKVVSDFKEGKEQLNPEEIKRRMALARAYNAMLSGHGQTFHDPYVSNVEEGVANYARMLEVREKIGVIRIPCIDVEEPIYAGTSEDVLQKGTGHMEYTSLPVGGDSTHSVITGHRGLPDKKIFSALNNVKEKDRFYIENIEQILAYEVDQIKVIEPSVFDDLQIVQGKDYVTLLTCTPYMINSHRLLVRGHRIPYVPEVAKQDMNRAQLQFMIKMAVVLLIILLLFLLGLLWWRARRKKREWERRRRSGTKI